MFDLISHEIKDYSVSVLVRHKALDVVIRFINVYGSSYEEEKDLFISELHTLFSTFQGHTIIGGDFNLVRFQEDKSNGVIDHKWSDKFNAWVEIWSLLEVKLSCRKFTWGNNQDNLIMSTIDRFFCNPEVDSIFPLASIRALPRLASDHTPIIWDAGLSSIPAPSGYKFEKWWLMREEFKEVVSKSWNAPTRGSSSIDIWQTKIRRLRQVTKGWNSNIEAELRKLKKNLMEEYDSLDLKAESDELSPDELCRLKEIYAEMHSLWLK
jgi:hypothetical protein